MKIPMTDTEFEKLKESIAKKIAELGCLQELYKKETGRNYIPAFCIITKNKLNASLLNAKEDLQQYCTEW